MVLCNGCGEALDFMARKKSFWFNSTLAVLATLFLAFVTIGVWRYGWQAVLDNSIMYAIGCTFTAILVLISTGIYKRWGLFK